jgi:hypothetical protein
MAAASFCDQRVEDCRNGRGARHDEVPQRLRRTVCEPVRDDRDVGVSEVLHPVEVFPSEWTNDFELDASTRLTA